jgi:hypothetical protein
MTKVTTTIKQVLNYQADYGAWFAANQALYNQTCAFYFGVIQAHENVLDLSNKDALTAFEKLTHTTQSNPIQSCHSQKWQRISQRCSGGHRSMRLLDLHARSTRIWANGVREKRRQQPSARSSPSAHQFLHVHGTCLPRSMRVCGSNELVPLSCIGLALK